MSTTEDEAGLRATLLKNLVDMIVERAVNRVNFTTFKKCFPAELVQNANDVASLKKVHERLLAGLASSIKVCYN